MIDPKKKNVYCEFQFWEKFVSMNVDGAFSVYDDHKFEAELVWISILKLIREKANFFLNEKEKGLYEGLIADGDGHTKRLHKLKTDGGSVEFIKDFPSIDSLADGAQLCAIYLYGDADMLIPKAESKGVFVITPATLSDFVNVNKDTGKSIKRKMEFNWEFLNVNREKCNSMIIIDKFIDRWPNKNLYAILDTLVPKKLSVPFHLTVFEKEEHGTIENLYNEILTWQKNYRSKLDMKITVCRLSEVHDRVIITNKRWFKSGAGFDLITPENCAENTTEINIVYPFIQNFSEVVDGSYLSSITDASRCLRTNIKQGCGINRILL